MKAATFNRSLYEVPRIAVFVRRDDFSVALYIAMLHSPCIVYEMVALYCLLSSFTTCFLPQSIQLCVHINFILWTNFILKWFAFVNLHLSMVFIEHTQRGIYMCVCVTDESHFTKHSVC